MTTDREKLLPWAAQANIGDAIFDDPRLPEDPVTLRGFSDELCVEEGITDPIQQQRRWHTVQRWPKVYADTFPAPAIPEPPRRGRGRPPMIWSRRILAQWLRDHGPVKHYTSKENLDRLASMSQPMTLRKIADVLGLHIDTLHQERRASRGRVAAGTPMRIEFPDPVSGTHADVNVEYDPQKVAEFWRNRPGKSRRTHSGKRTRS